MVSCWNIVFKFNYPTFCFHFFCFCFDFDNIFNFFWFFHFDERYISSVFNCKNFVIFLKKFVDFFVLFEYVLLFISCQLLKYSVTISESLLNKFNYFFSQFVFIHVEIFLVVNKTSDWSPDFIQKKKNPSTNQITIILKFCGKFPRKIPKIFVKI